MCMILWTSCLLRVDCKRSLCVLVVKRCVGEDASTKGYERKGRCDLTRNLERRAIQPLACIVERDSGYTREGIVVVSATVSDV